MICAIQIAGHQASRSKSKTYHVGIYINKFSNNAFINNKNLLCMNAGNTMVVSISRNEIPLIAIATYVTESNQVLLTTYTDVTRINILLQQILIYNPTKLVIEECQQEYIYDIHKIFETLEICPLDRSKFNDKNFERFANSSIYDAIGCNYFLRSALTALVDFINIDCTNIYLTIKALENRLRMDYQTIIDLNLVKNSANRKNLLNSIDYTQTSVGRRLLRENVIQPFANVDLITPRHEVIRFLSNNTEFAEGLSKLLSGFSALHAIMKNTSSIVSGMTKDEKSVIITAIKTFKMFDSISQLHGFLCRYTFDEQSLFASLEKECKTINETNVMIILERYLDLDYLKNCNTISIDTIVKCVKTSADPYLKLAVQIYTENIADLYNEITEIKSTLPESVLHYDTKFGYTIKVKQDHLKLLADAQTQNLIIKTDHNTRIKSYSALEYQNYIPRQQTHTSSYDHNSSTMSDIEFVTSENALYNVQSNKSEKVQAKDSVSKDGNFRKKNATEEVEARLNPIVLKRMGNYYLFTTESFERSNFRTLEGIEQVLQISHERCAQMIKEISIVHCKITDLSLLIAELDICSSLHLFSKFDDSCIPSFGDSVVISNTYHLLTEKRDRIKNNIYACPRMFFNIVTGANMSGKTTYMKMIAHNIILAQIGAPLRGKMAKTKIFKEILTRLSHDSGQTDNMSTFEKEVHMIKDILSIANKDSLVLLDEIGRGTNYEDGISFALFVSKQLINKECFTYFTTHFVNIIKYLKNDAGVNVIKCQNWSIKSGVCEESNGIEICKDYFPEKMINDAKEIKKKIFGLSANVDFDNQIVQIALKIMGCTDEDERKELMLQLQK